MLSTHLRLVITNFTVRPVGGIKVELACTFFSPAIFCYSRAGVEVVLTRAGLMQVREREKGEEVTEVFIRMDYANDGEKKKAKFWVMKKVGGTPRCSLNKIKELECEYRRRRKEQEAVDRV